METAKVRREDDEKKTASILGPFEFALGAIEPRGCAVAFSGAHAGCESGGPPHLSLSLSGS